MYMYGLLGYHLTVHLTSVSLRGYLYVHVWVVRVSPDCTPYICIIKGLPVHHTSVSYLCIPYVCVVKGLITCTLYICVVKGSPQYTVHLCR